MSLEKKKTQVELMRVQTARMELEYKIEERKEEIRRMEEHIKIQNEKEAELTEKLKGMEG
jgi:hypothetical protein